VFALREAESDAAGLSWQASLFGRCGPGRAEPERHQLDADSWIETAPGWLEKPDDIFHHLLSDLSWEQREMAMYEKTVWQPRLSAEPTCSDLDPALKTAIDELGARYELVLDQFFVNLYRGGRDSVAWHDDKIGAIAHEPVVVILSLGATRTFRIRPMTGGRSQGFTVSHGDLLVMGGRCQHDWEHCVPKTAASVGPRVSFTARHLKGGA